MSAGKDREKAAPAARNSARPAGVSRRALLKRGAVSMPAILTLQSGAALARSSNLISASSTETTDPLGRTLCLDPNSVYPTATPGVYDLGDPPEGTLNIITQREYFEAIVRNPHDAVRVTSGQVCERGGTFWWQDSHDQQWYPIEMPYNGIVLSTGAVTSMTHALHDNLV